MKAHAASPKKMLDREIGIGDSRCRCETQNARGQDRLLARKEKAGVLPFSFNSTCTILFQKYKPFFQSR